MHGLRGCDGYKKEKQVFSWLLSLPCRSGLLRPETHPLKQISSIIRSKYSGGRGPLRYHRQHLLQRYHAVRIRHALLFLLLLLLFLDGSPFTSRSTRVCDCLVPLHKKVGIMEVDSERMRMRLMPSPVQCLNAIKVRIVYGTEVVVFEPDRKNGQPLFSSIVATDTHTVCVKQVVCVSERNT